MISPSPARGEEGAGGFALQDRASLSQPPNSLIGTCRLDCGRAMGARSPPRRWIVEHPKMHIIQPTPAWPPRGPTGSAVSDPSKGGHVIDFTNELDASARIG